MTLKSTLSTSVKRYVQSRKEVVLTDSSFLCFRHSISSTLASHLHLDWICSWESDIFPCKLTLEISPNYEFPNTHSSTKKGGEDRVWSMWLTVSMSVFLSFFGFCVSRICENLQFRKVPVIVSTYQCIGSFWYMVLMRGSVLGGLHYSLPFILPGFYVTSTELRDYGFLFQFYSDLYRIFILDVMERVLKNYWDNLAANWNIIVTPISSLMTNFPFPSFIIFCPILYTIFCHHFLKKGKNCGSLWYLITSWTISDLSQLLRHSYCRNFRHFWNFHQYQRLQGA